jgi:hypothetical protein
LIEIALRQFPLGDALFFQHPDRRAESGQRLLDEVGGVRSRDQGAVAVEVDAVEDNGLPERAAGYSAPVT